MKKMLLTILLASMVFTTTIPTYIYAQEEETTTEESTTQDTSTEDITDEEETSSEESLDTSLEDVTQDSGISIWTILFAIVGASLFIAVAYYILKTFNL